MLGAQSTARGYIRADVSLTKVHLRMVCTSSSYASTLDFVCCGFKREVPLHCTAGAEDLSKGSRKTM